MPKKSFNCNVIGCTEVPIGCTEAHIGCTEVPIGCTEPPQGLGASQGTCQPIGQAG